MVIDLTYICNFTCHYCQWGDPTNEKRKNIQLGKLLVKSKSLKQMGVERIVFSGGEPLLHPNFREIVGYYGKAVNEVVMITNGLLLDDKHLEDYCESSRSPSGYPSPHNYNAATSCVKRLDYRYARFHKRR